MIKSLLKEALQEQTMLQELGDSQIAPFEMSDESATSVRGMPVLQEVFYTFEAGDENVLVHFKGIKKREVKGRTLFDYSVTFVSNFKLEKTNNMKTVFIKMSTIFQGIIPAFLRYYAKNFVTRVTNLGKLEIRGIAEKQKGEVETGDDTGRTKMYTYFATKFTPANFTMEKIGNTINFVNNI
jgi:hypothetical protein